MGTRLHSVGFEKIKRSKRKKKSRREFLVKTFLLMMMLIFIKTMFAQVSNYSFSEDLITYTEISGGTVYNSGNGPSRIDDQTYNNLPIGFTFNYDGIDYTQISISANGFIAFSSSVSNSFNPLSSATASNNVVSALGFDLQAVEKNAGSNIRYQTIGSAPNRTLVVQWTNFQRYGQSGMNIDFQIRLEEANGEIHFVYGNNTNLNTNLYQPEVGLRGANSSQFVNRKSSGVGPWLGNNQAGLLNSDGMNFTSGSMPANGTRFKWGNSCNGLPDGGTSSADVTVSCSGVDFTLSTSGQTMGGNGISYVWQSGPTVAGPWTNIGSVTTSYSDLTISQSSATYYRLLTSCDNSGLDAGSTPVFVDLGGDCECLSYPLNFAGSSLDTDISQVVVGTLSNTSDCSTPAPGVGSVLGRYGNYSGAVVAPDLAQNSVVNFDLTMTSCGGQYSNFFQIYIDWNHDGDFLDANEQVYSQSSSVLGNQTASGTFTVPCDVQTGITRMRVVVVEAAASNTNYAHTPYSYGETEDYCINVVQGSGLPVVTCPSDITEFADANCQAIVNYSATANVGILSYEFSGATVGSGAGSGSGELFEQGITNVTVTATDGICSSSCQFTVTVEDTTGADIVVPSDITVSSDPGNCDAVVTFNYPTATDNCGAPMNQQGFLYSGAPDAIPDQGTLTTDLVISGMNNSLGANVDLSSLCLNIEHTYDGDLDIFITSPQGTTLELTTDNGSSGDNYFNTCFDMSASTPITSGFAPFSGSYLPEGAGGFSVFDGEDPNGTWTLSVSDDAAFDTGQLLFWSLNFENNGFVINQTGGLASGSVFPVGVTTNTYETTDLNGNVSVASFTITIEDNELPVASCPADIQVNADANQCSAFIADLGSVTASDNCGILQITNDAPATFPVGSTTVTYTIEDLHGNTAQCSQVVTVIDAEAPTISCPEDQSLTLDANCNAIVPDYTALGNPADNCSGFVVTQSPVAGTTVAGGSIVITLTVTDASGNSAQCTFNAISNSAPAILNPAANLTVECDGAGNSTDLNNWLNNNGGATVNELCSSVTWSNDFAGLSDLCGQTGAAVVTFTATDGFGNSVSTTATFTIEDTTPPSLAGIADTSYDSDPGLCGAYISESVPAVTDLCDLSPAAATSSYDFNIPLPVGTTYIFYTATDECGNSDTTGHYITINDIEAPIIANANDLLINISGNTDLSEVSWSLVDQNGDSLASGGGYSFASSNYVLVDFDSLNQFSAPYIFNISTDGGIGGLNDNVVDWEILCNGGVLSSGTLNGGLESLNNPVIPCSEEELTFYSSSAECFYTIAGIALDPFVQENCSLENGSPNFTISGAGANVSSGTSLNGVVFNIGTSVVTWNATDIYGNSSSNSMVINVIDTIAPIAICQDLIVELDALGQVSITPSQIDNGSNDACGILSLELDIENFDCSNVGVNTVVLTVTDNNGNISICSASVTVEDNIAPSITCPSDITLSNDANLCSAVHTPADVLFSDNCAVS
ncbi:MAG: HYR domain-containing protein, partial [Crocinitomicaceae bacterium]